MNYSIVGLLVIICFLPACWGPSSKETVDYTHHETTREDIPLGTQTRISTDLNVGDITIHGWDKALVSIDKRKYAATDAALALIESEIVAAETNIEIRTKLKRHNVEGIIHYDVKAPYALRLQTIHNKAGNVMIEDMRGSMDIATESGSIRVHGAQDDVSLKTHSGNVHLSFAENAVAKTKIHTGSGDVQIMHAARDVEIKTDSGSVAFTHVITAQGTVHIESRSGRIRVSNVVSNLKLETSSGSLLVDLGDIRPGSVITLTTKSGRVTVVVPRTIDLAIDARTESGSIRSDFSLEHEKNHVFGVVGAKHDTRNRLTIHTTSGNIAIQKK